LYKNTVTLLNDNPYVFLQVEGAERQAFGGSYNNTAEAEAVAELVKRLRRDEGQWYSAEKIRIITFYQAQVSLLKRILSERGLGQIVVSTVDSSQGCEADIVIVSFVRSIDVQTRGGKHTAGFLSDDRRLNVALTRAKYQLICVGNAHGFKSLPEASTLKALSHDATDRDCVCPQMFLGLSSFNKNRDGKNNQGKNIGGKRNKQRPGNRDKSRKRQKSRHGSQKGDKQGKGSNGSN
jgi:superfamily I DNA and/or RNA helicase